MRLGVNTGAEQR